ncbi:MAG: CarD family transcriptional regulator [Lachnospiraceae bacterium]|nr:CarD family transcriptional regulator [Lachnospiraceae bacterium]
MFNIGEYVACGNKGVCKIDQITTLDISGVDKDEKYYILKPVYSAASTVYIPVALADESVRPILTGEQAKDFVSAIPDIECLDIPNEKMVEGLYKGCVRSNDMKQLVSLVKTIYERRQKRIAAGRKETAVDAKYYRIAAEFLFGELAISLDVPKNEVEDIITKSGWSK